MSDNRVIFKKTRRVFYKLSFALNKTEESGEFALSQTKKDSELRSYFTQYILVVFYSEFEDKRKDALQEALKAHSTEGLSQFISTVMDTLFKRMNKTKLLKTIAYFGNDRRGKFKSLISEEDLQKYQTFIENRHKAAHGASISLSWEEAKNMTNIGERIIAAIQESLY